MTRARHEGWYGHCLSRRLLGCSGSNRVGVQCRGECAAGLVGPCQLKGVGRWRLNR